MEIFIICARLKKKIDGFEFIIYIELMLKYHHFEYKKIVSFNTCLFYLNNKALFHD